MEETKSKEEKRGAVLVKIMAGVLIGVIVCIWLGLFGAGIATAFVWHTGGIWVFLGFMVLALIGFIIGSEYDFEAFIVFVTLSAFFMFFGSWITGPTYLIEHQSQESTIYRHGMFIAPPYGFDVTYLASSIELGSRLTIITADGNKEVWDLRATYILIPQYDMVLNSVKQQGGINGWKSALKQALNRIANDQLTLLSRENQVSIRSFEVMIQNNDRRILQNEFSIAIDKNKIITNRIFP